MVLRGRVAHRSTIRLPTSVGGSVRQLHARSHTLQLPRHPSFTRSTASAAPQQATISEAVMLYLIYMIVSYRNEARARAIAANDTDYRQAA
ncbi:hypothetical protein [Sphingomonas sp. Leaf231]|uniref:hypothetical protein n=1 Tax=Sphingomonas sp. Leaf231 TaxID=1736301 RepID=UPI000A459D8B|nr:hypothetical protein [Sphingomonas sp. Leaf231]